MFFHQLRSFARKRSNGWKWQNLHCLRCKTVPLVEAEPFVWEVAFFRCPSCQRDYTLKAGRTLTFRWLHPISLPIYGIQFEKSLAGAAESVANELIKDQSKEWLALFVQEARLELDEPTQLIGDMIDCQVSEDDLRNFLRSVMEQIERRLWL